VVRSWSGLLRGDELAVGVGFELFFQGAVVVGPDVGDVDLEVGGGEVGGAAEVGLEDLEAGVAEALVSAAATPARQRQRTVRLRWWRLGRTRSR